MMLRELGGALASMADGPHDERRNSLELLNNILEVLSRHHVVRQNTAAASPAHNSRIVDYCLKGYRVGQSTPSWCDRTGIMEGVKLLSWMRP